MSCAKCVARRTTNNMADGDGETSSEASSLSSAAHMAGQASNSTQTAEEARAAWEERTLAFLAAGKAQLADGTPVAKFMQMQKMDHALRLAVDEGKPLDKACADPATRTSSPKHSALTASVAFVNMFMLCVCTASGQCCVAQPPLRSMRRRRAPRQPKSRRCAKLSGQKRRRRRPTLAAAPHESIPPPCTPPTARRIRRRPRAQEVWVSCEAAIHGIRPRPRLLATERGSRRRLEKRMCRTCLEGRRLCLIDATLFFCNVRLLSAFVTTVTAYIDAHSHKFDSVTLTKVWICAF